MGLVELQRRNMLKLYETLVGRGLNVAVGAFGLWTIHREFLRPDSAVELLANLVFVMGVVLCAPVFLLLPFVGLQSLMLSMGKSRLADELAGGWMLFIAQIVVWSMVYIGNEPGLTLRLFPAIIICLAVALLPSYRIVKIIQEK
jgi:hypothetical protein